MAEQQKPLTPLQRWAGHTLGVGAAAAAVGALSGFLRSEPAHFFAAAYGVNSMLFAGAFLGLRSLALHAPATFGWTAAPDARVVSAASGAIVGGAATGLVSGLRKSPAGAALWAAVGWLGEEGLAAGERWRKQQAWILATRDALLVRLTQEERAAWAERERMGSGKPQQAEAGAGPRDTRESARMQRLRALESYVVQREVERSGGAAGGGAAASAGTAGAAGAGAAVGARVLPPPGTDLNVFLGLRRAGEAGTWQTLLNAGAAAAAAVGDSGGAGSVSSPSAAAAGGDAAGVGAPGASAAADAARPGFRPWLPVSTDAVASDARRLDKLQARLREVEELLGLVAPPADPRAVELRRREAEVEQRLAQLEARAASGGAGPAAQKQ